MTTDQLIQEIKSYCTKNADAERVRKSQRYFKEEFVGYGLTSTQIQDKVKELLKSGGIDLSAVLEVAPALMRSGQYEEISFALLLLDGLSKQFTPETFRIISSWFSFSIHNWAHADTLGMFTDRKSVV